MRRPGIDATAAKIEQYVRSWVKAAANEGFEVALSYLDPNPDVPWSDQLFDEYTYNHFDDDEHCHITDPDLIDGLRVGVYAYDDGSGFAVDHDLAMNGKRSDFTAQFDIRKGKSHLIIILRDIHVL